VTIEVGLWLGLLAVLAGLFVLTTRRMSALVRRTRDLEGFQQAVDALDRRFAGVVAPLVRSLDETRRHAGDPEALRDRATESEAVLQALASEARSLAAPAALAATASALEWEVDRAVRAASLVVHGLASLGTTSIGRDLEAQTALKRGSLNLRHAQEAFARRAREVSRLRPNDLAPGGAIPASLSAPGGRWTAEDEDA
jgi:hypothetical protein